MNPIYKFYLFGNGAGQTAFPVYKDDLAIEYAHENGEQFYRGALAGKLTFEGEDYAFIVGKPFDTEFGLIISISYDNGATWAQYWEGAFWKTDCEFNADDETVIVTPTLKDQYTDVLAGLEKEFDLISLAPEITPIKADKRPMIQVYVPGQSVIGCFLSGMWWEQECEAISDENDLQTQYYFAYNVGLRAYHITQTGNPQIPSVYYGPIPANIGDTYEYQNGNYALRHWVTGTPGGIRVNHWAIIRLADNKIMWDFYDSLVGVIDVQNGTMNPVNPDASGTVYFERTDIKVYARYITDVVNAQTYPIPLNDMAGDNRNYSRVTPYYAPNTIYIWNYLTANPTPWGIYQPGQYYANPEDYGSTQIDEAFPVARNAWSDFSIWFAPNLVQILQEQQWRQEFTMRDCYPLSSVISVLLGQIAPGISHAATTDYSQFLYAASNPISNIAQTLFLTPKSNVISSGYDQPAQKAPVTLKTILNMLRDCFRCYWFIDSQKRFRIEHISFFMNGGAYPGTPDYPVIGIDLTAETITRNGKALSFATNQYKFDKPEMAARYQFGWMDEVTQEFEGFPIDILSKYVTPGNVQEIIISQFTSDVDYILLNPLDISKDGFVLLGATLNAGQYELPYYNYVHDSLDHYLQNGWLSFAFLQGYYAYDMPAKNYEINGVSFVAVGIKKLKEQSLKFPVLTDPDLLELIKTGIGNGVIEKLSLNLCSRNATATLRYDTE